MPRDDIPETPDTDARHARRPPTLQRRRRGRTAGGPAGRPRARRLGGVLSAVVLVAAGGGLVSATALTPQGPGSSRPLAAPLAAVPAGSSVGVCPGPARLLEGAPVGTDPQFSPESATAKSDVSAVVLGSSAGVLPGSRLASLTGGTLVELAKAAPASETPVRGPGQARTRRAAGRRRGPAGRRRRERPERRCPRQTARPPPAPSCATRPRTATSAVPRPQPASSPATISGWSARTPRSAGRPC